MQLRPKTKQSAFFILTITLPHWLLKIGTKFFKITFLTIAREAGVSFFNVVSSIVTQI